MSEPKKQYTTLQRKARKFKREPVQFVTDSKAYIKAQKTMYVTRAKLGSFVMVILASLLVVAYYTLFASPRFVSESQFIVKQAGNNALPIAGFAAIGTTSPSMRDALILQTYIESREMAMALAESVSLNTHFESEEWDWFSRLRKGSSKEEYVEYYRRHIKASYDEMSEVLTVEVQSFEAEYSLIVARELLKISEAFINRLGEKVLKQQMDYAQSDVERSYLELKVQQSKLVSFQDEFKLYNPELQGSALVGAINQLEAEIIREETELKSLLAFMRKDSSEVKVKQVRLDSLRAQLDKEKKRLTEKDHESLNKINMDFQEIKLNTKLASDLYQSSLASLEKVRSEAYRKLKHLLVIEQPSLAEDDKYPRRIYNILTWFISLLLFYGVGRLIVAIIKEHKE